MYRIPKGFSPRLAARAALAVVVGCCALLTGCASSGPKVLHEDWQTISVAGLPIGYMRSTTRRLHPDDETIVTTVSGKSRYTRLGYTVTVQTLSEYIEGLDGSLRYASSATTIGSMENTCRARLEGDKLNIETVVAGKKYTRTIPWTPDIIGPYCQLELTKLALKEGGSMDYKTFVPDFKRVSKAKLNIIDRRDLTVNGATQSLWYGTLEQDVLPGVKTEVWLDDDGDVIRSSTNLMGGMETRKATEVQALATVAPSNTADIMDKFFITVNREIENPYELKEALYQLETTDDALTKVHLADRRQTIEKREGNTVFLRVRALGDAEKPSGKTPGGKFREPTPYLQSDDPEIIQLSNEGVGDAETPYAKALNLRQWVYKRIRKKDFTVAFASAKEVAVSRQGDCTEHAVLLAALLRAQGIPSRVAVGLVYYKGRFGYHMWTEAFLNDWTALDAAMNQDVVDATHISFTTSALADTSTSEPFTSMLSIIGNLKLTIEDVPK